MTLLCTGGCPRTNTKVLMRSGSLFKFYRFNILRSKHAYRRDKTSIAQYPHQDKFKDEIALPCTGAAKPRLVRGLPCTGGAPKGRRLVQGWRGFRRWYATIRFEFFLRYRLNPFPICIFAFPQHPAISFQPCNHILMCLTKI